MAAEKFSPEIVTLGEILYGFLARFHSGKNGAITYDRLYACSGDWWMNNRRPTRREIRRACKAILRVLEKPCISCSSGVFIAQTQEEIDAFVADQKSRAGEMYANADSAEKCSPARKVESGFFEFAS